MNQNNPAKSPANGDLVPARDYRDIIAAVAKVKDVDVAKLERLMQLQEEWEKKRAAEYYNDQMAKAQGEMRTVSTDSANPVFRSTYASLAGVDKAIRPIYTKYGFSVTFDEHQTDRDDGLLLIADVSCGAETRRYRKWIPVSSQGLRGGSATTPTHAAIGAVTYGRRTLLKMIFNLAEEDSDGNLDGDKNDKRSVLPSGSPNWQRKPLPSSDQRARAELLQAANKAQPLSSEAAATVMIEQIKGCMTAASLERWNNASEIDYEQLLESDKTRVDEAYRTQAQAIADAAKTAAAAKGATQPEGKPK